ncbi:hypothetical protein ACFY20_08865 [Streptomyces sp. NPDC001312]|uniref:hypothetical protein n=1 Tax=Streptomyces sp. NPDC001312 TaxID=3364561 RepID=UPI0036C544DC
MKVYRRHNCQTRHTTWPDLARCIWPHATIDGDGRYGAVACGARAVTLYATPELAQARKHGFDRDGCRPKCHRHHNVVALDPDAEPKVPRAATRSATQAAAPTPSQPASRPRPKPEAPICGRPRTNGEPCLRSAGWGADPGESACRDHGGSTVKRRAEAERLVEQALTFARLAEKARTTPLTAEERLQIEAAARDVLAARNGRRGISSGELSALGGWPVCPPVVEVAGSAGGSLGLLIAELSRRLGGEAP